METVRRKGKYISRLYDPVVPVCLAQWEPMYFRIKGESGLYREDMREIYLPATYTEPILQAYRNSIEGIYLVYLPYMSHFPQMGHVRKDLPVYEMSF